MTKPSCQNGSWDPWRRLNAPLDALVGQRGATDVRFIQGFIYEFDWNTTHESASQGDPKAPNWSAMEAKWSPKGAQGTQMNATRPPNRAQNAEFTQRRFHQGPAFGGLFFCFYRFFVFNCLYRKKKGDERQRAASFPPSCSNHAFDTRITNKF